MLKIKKFFNKLIINSKKKDTMMKKRVLTMAGTITALLAFFTVTLLADNDALHLKNSGTTIDSVIQSIENQKLTNVKSIEFDDRQWEVKTLSNNMESKYIHNSQASAPTQAPVPADKQVIPNAKIQAVSAVQPAVAADVSLTLVKQEKENDLQPPADLASLTNAVKAVQTKGYNVYSVDYEGNCWEVEAYDSNNLEYTVLVNVADGKVLNTKVDD
jgi:hypothetical protein